jgi:hypothetical protein
MLQFIERRGLNLLKGERQRCAVFEQRYVFADPPGGSVTRRGSLTSRSLEFHSGGNVINLPAGQPYSCATEAELIFGVPDTSFNCLLCLEAYAQVVDRAVRILLTRFNATPAKNVYSEPVYLIPNLKDEARKALTEATNQPMEYLQYEGLCSMPPSQGLQSGANEVRCGVWSFKSQGGDPTLEKSGVKWLAQDYIMGRKVLFAEGQSVETGTTRQTIEGVSKTREQSQGHSTSQGATVVKPGH